MNATRRTSIQRHIVGVMLAVTAATMMTAGSAISDPPANHGKGRAAPTAVHIAMRKLWQDHVLWTRLVIVSTFAGLPDQEATTQRLLRNQADIGNAIKPYFGEAAGDKLTGLLKTHIVQAADILAAAKANDSARLESAKTAWFANADDIATFLSAANPKAWPLADMKSMMRKHLELTLAEAVNQLQGHYAESVADFDRVQDEILQMADMLSDGIARLPKKS